MKINRKHKIIFSSIAVVAVIVASVILTKAYNNKNLVKCEELIENYILAINDRDADMHTYEDDSSIEAEMKYKKYYEELVGRDEVYHQNAYDKKYLWDLNFIETCVGEDFNITYSVNNKTTLGLKTLRYIQNELRDVGLINLDYLKNDEELIHNNLSNFNVTDDEIEKNLELNRKYFKQQSLVNVTSAYKLDVTFAVKGKEIIEFQKDIYFAVVNGDLILLDYEPEEPEEDNEHFGFSNGLNPTMMADEVERFFMEFDASNRGANQMYRGDWILIDFSEWIQNDGSGNRLNVYQDEETYIETLEYVDATGNAIKGFEGDNYLHYENFSEFIYIYSKCDEENYEYSELKNTIVLLYCNEDIAVFEIDGKRVEFISEN